MKKSRFTDEQIIGFLKQVEGGVPVKELCRKHGFSDATFYKWRSRLGGLDVSEARRLRGVGCSHRQGSCRAAAQVVRADAAARRRSRRADDGGTRQTTRGSKGRSRLRRLVHRMVCRGRQAALRRRHPRSPARQAHPRAAPAGRRRRGNHAVEFSRRDDHAQVGARARGRLHVRLQTCHSDAVLSARDGRARAPCRHHAGCLQRDHGPIERAGRRAHFEPGGAQAHLHRFDRSREEALGAVRRHIEEGFARTRRQCAVHRVRRRGSRRRRAGAIASKYRNTGQTCVCANRLLVQEGVYDAFVEKLITAVRTLRVGDGLRGATDQGPLIDAKALAKVEEHIADALANGGQVALGGKRHALGGTFFEPTILTGITPSMMVAREETFGPVAPVFAFKTETDAVRMANDTEFGLASYFYTRDLARAFRVAEKLEYGIVGLNTGLISTEVAQFGGVKESGSGREGSKFGILDYTELKYLCIGGIEG